jgi:hypothetical protein
MQTLSILILSSSLGLEFLEAIPTDGRLTVSALNVALHPCEVGAQGDSFTATTSDLLCFPSNL